MENIKYNKEDQRHEDATLTNLRDKNECHMKTKHLLPLI